MAWNIVYFGVAAAPQLVSAGLGQLVVSGYAPSASVGSTADPEATTNQKYVRADATGTGSGDDWTNAYTSIPASLARDTTYWFATGSYGSYTCDDAENGTQVIRFKKATVALHGTSTGWSDAYSGVVTFGDITLQADYFTFDGSTRNESDWADGTAYGFRVTGFEAPSDATRPASFLTFRYINAGGTEGSSYTGSEPEFCWKVSSFGTSDATTWLIHRCYAHNIAHAAQFHMNGIDGVTYEYCMVKNGWGKEGIRGQIAHKNGVIRWNVFWNAGMNSGVPGEGCTAEIALWDGSTGDFDGNKIYGNVFFRNNAEENSGGTIVVGGDNGVSWAGSPANNTLVYNNTIAGVEGGGSGGNILINGGTGNVARNNLWYDVVSSGVSANTTSDNDVAGADPFVSYATGNLRLSGATGPGTSLSSPFDVDMDGVTRGGDGTWDVGAFEYAA